MPDPREDSERPRDHSGHFPVMDQAPLATDRPQALRRLSRTIAQAQWWAGWAKSATLLNEAAAELEMLRTALNGPRFAPSAAGVDVEALMHRKIQKITVLGRGDDVDFVLISAAERDAIVASLEGR